MFPNNSFNLLSPRIKILEISLKTEAEYFLSRILFQTPFELNDAHQYLLNWFK